MSDDIGKGFKEAFEGVVGGIIISTLWAIIPTLPFVPSYYVGIFQLLQVVSLVGGIFLIFAMESWGLGYLLGWLLGMWALSSVGLVESWLFTLYAVVGAVVIIGKIFQKIEHSLRSF
jgi:hypothetical protein